MKKKLLSPVYISISPFFLSQVGMNQPNPGADLELGSYNKSLLLNGIPSTNAVINPINDMMIYDLSEECVKAYQESK